MSERIIPSNILRELVTAELKKRNQPTIAESYSRYSKKNVQLQTNRLNAGMNTHAKQSAKDKDNTSGRGIKIGYQGHGDY